MFCSKCGANLPDGSVFCSTCGQNLKAQNQPAYQNQPVQGQGIYQTTPGYQMPPVQYPPRRRNTGLIVLLCVLSVVVLAAIIVICVLVIPPKDTPVIASKTPGVSASVEPTAAPSETVVPTPVVTGTITGFPYEFVQLSYPEADFAPKLFNSIEDFESELTATAWVYYEARSNPDAVSFNGGFADIGYYDTAQSVYEYEFGSDYKLQRYQLNANDFTVTNQDSISYWTQASGNIYLACYDLGIDVELSGTAYKTAITMFINEMGDLVLSMALYEPYKNEFVPISNYDIYQKSMAEINTNNNNGEMTQQQFESALQSSVWTYSETIDGTPEMEIEEYRDITPGDPYRLKFSPDMSLEYITFNAADGTVLSDESSTYVFGNNHAYVMLEEYEQGGVTYEIDAYYFIDTNGNLEEQIMAYDDTAGIYYMLSNVNIYKGGTP